MQYPPPTLPGRGPASIQLSAKARRASPLSRSLYAPNWSSMNAVASGHRPGSPRIANRREQVVPGEFGIPSSTRLQPEIAPEVWKGSTRLLDHHIEDVTVDGAPEE